MTMTLARCSHFLIQLQPYCSWFEFPLGAHHFFLPAPLLLEPGVDLGVLVPVLVRIWSTRSWFVGLCATLIMVSSASVSSYSIFSRKSSSNSSWYSINSFRFSSSGSTLSSSYLLDCCSCWSFDSGELEIHDLAIFADSSCSFALNLGCEEYITIAFWGNDFFQFWFSEMVTR